MICDLLLTYIRQWKSDGVVNHLDPDYAAELVLSYLGMKGYTKNNVLGLMRRGVRFQTPHSWVYCCRVGQYDPTPAAER